MVVKTKKVITFNNDEPALINKSPKIKDHFCPRKEKFIEVVLDLPQCTTGTNMRDILESEVAYEVQVLDGQCTNAVAGIEAVFDGYWIEVIADEDYNNPGALCVRLTATPTTTGVAQEFDFFLAPKCDKPQIKLTKGNYITAGRT